MLIRFAAEELRTRQDHWCRTQGRVTENSLVLYAWPSLAALSVKSISARRGDTEGHPYRTDSIRSLAKALSSRTLDLLHASGDEKRVLGYIFQWTEFIDARIVYQNVEPAEGALRFSKEPLDVILQ